MNGRTDLIRGELGYSEGSAIDSICRRLLIQMLSRLQYGRLVICEGDRKWSFGNDETLRASMRVHDPSLYRKVIFGGSIGAGEAYIEELWDVDDLTALVRIMVLNMKLLDRMERGLAWLVIPFNRIRHILNRNSRHGARKNILSHYDLGNDLYKAFLDSAMIYSSAIYPKKRSTLEEAQEHKLETLCRKLDLQPSDSVIEIGSGWGGFALYAASNYGCHVTTTTISDAQYKEASKRISAAGMADKITLLQKDYRDLAGKFDKLVSVEMVEAVGHRYLPGFFKKCCELLTPEGKMVIQAITIVDQKYKQYIAGVDFIQRYIFPGGCVPSINRMVESITEKSDMVVRRIDDFGYDYARTIDDWRKRFHDAYPKLQERGYDERFRRLWEFYLCYCQGGFLERSISVVHLTATRPANR